MPSPISTLTRRAAALVLALAAPAALPAGVTVGLDAAALNEVLPAMAPAGFDVDVGGRTLHILLRDFQVVGFDPGAGGDSAGRILTRVRVEVPSLGLDVPMQPRLALGVAEREGASVLELRFEGADLPLPLLGSVDLGTFIEPLRFPAANAWPVEAASGEVEVRSRLTAVRMGKQQLLFDFELRVAPPAVAGAGGQGR